MADELPILHSLLGSLSTINQRLNRIESVLHLEPLHLEPLHLASAADAPKAAAAGTAAEVGAPVATVATQNNDEAAPQVPLRLGRERPAAAPDPQLLAGSIASALPSSPAYDDGSSQEGGGGGGGGDNAKAAGDHSATTQPSTAAADGAPEESARGHSSDASGAQPLEAPPEGFEMVSGGRATLQDELDAWTLPRGYSLRINGTRTYGHREKIRMMCFRGGVSRLRGAAAEEAGGHPPRPVHPRKLATERIGRKCDCPFRFELVELDDGPGRYTVHYTNADHMRHNHGPADLLLDPRARKLPHDLKAQVDQWLRGTAPSGRRGRGSSSETAGASADGGDAPGWTIAKIQAELQRRGYEHVLDFDLRNRKRALLNKDRQAQMQAAAGRPPAP